MQHRSTQVEKNIRARVKVNIMVGLVIAIILSVKGHKVGAWITYGICLSLSIMSSIGMANRNRVLYGRSGMTASSVMIFVVSYVVAFCVICFTGNSKS